MTWLKDIQRRLEAATPGPWHRGSESDHGWFLSCKGGSLGDIFGEKLDNSELIAHAPTDITKLIRVVEIYERALIAYSHDAIFYGNSTDDRAQKALTEAEKIGEGE